MTDLNNAVAALGRLLLSVIFLWSGFQKLAAAVLSATWRA